MPTAVRWLPHGLGYFCNLAFTAALFINILGCIWYYTARVEGIRPGHTWLAIVGAPQAEDAAFVNNNIYYFNIYDIVYKTHQIPWVHLVPHRLR